MYGKHSSRLAKHAQTNGPLIKLSTSGQTVEGIAHLTSTHLRFLRWMQLYRNLWMLENAPKRECKLGFPCLLLHILRRLIAIIPISSDLQRLGVRVEKKFRTLLNKQSDDQSTLLRCQRNIQHMSIRASMQLYIFTHRALALTQTIWIAIPSNTGADYG